MPTSVSSTLLPSPKKLVWLSYWVRPTKFGAPAGIAPVEPQGLRHSITSLHPGKDVESGAPATVGVLGSIMF